jgi:hypothetical protein
MEGTEEFRALPFGASMQNATRFLIESSLVGYHKMATTVMDRRTLWNVSYIAATCRSSSFG